MKCARRPSSGLTADAAELRFELSFMLWEILDCPIVAV